MILFWRPKMLTLTTFQYIFVKFIKLKAETCVVKRIFLSRGSMKRFSALPAGQNLYVAFPLRAASTSLSSSLFFLHRSAHAAETRCRTCLERRGKASVCGSLVTLRHWSLCSETCMWHLPKKTAEASWSSALGQGNFSHGLCSLTTFLQKKSSVRKGVSGYLQAIGESREVRNCSKCAIQKIFLIKQDTYMVRNKQAKGSSFK